MALLNEKIKIGKKGINYVTTVVDNNFCNFHPIMQENDVGIDGQIEIFNDDRSPKGEMIFIQIKTGNSYCRNNHCTIPIDGHEEYWKSLKLPVIGIVCLFDNKNQEVSNAYWVDIKKYLNYYEDEKRTNIVFAANKHNEFNQESFKKYFVPFIESKIPNISFDEAKQLVMLGDQDKKLGIEILCMKYAQYVETWELLFKEYELGMDDCDLPFFYDSISYVFSHPDHFYIKDHYELSNKSKEYIKSYLYKFTTSDICKMLEAIGDEEISRGTIGQSIEILIANIDSSNNKLTEILQFNDIPIYARKNAEIILAYHNPSFYINNVSKLNVPDSDFTNMLFDDIREYGCIDLY